MYVLKENYYCNKNFYSIFIKQNLLELCTRTQTLNDTQQTLGSGSMIFLIPLHSTTTRFKFMLHGNKTYTWEKH